MRVHLESSSATFVCHVSRESFPVLGFVEVGYSVTQVPDTERFAEDSEKGDLLVTELLRTAESNMAC